MQGSKITIHLDEFRPDESSPERTLFLCVILQALLDAAKPAYEGEPAAARIVRDRASAWFFASVGTTAQYFEEVCINAGVDADYMRECAYKFLQIGEIEFVR